MVTQRKKMQGSKGGGGETYTPSEAPDSLNSTALAKILLGLSEGEVDAITAGQLYKIILLDGTVVENADGSRNFPDVFAEFRPGSQDQTSIKGISAVENETAVNVALKYGEAAAFTRSFNNLDLSAVRIRLGIPTLMHQTDKGDREGSRVDYRIDIRTDGGAWQTVNTYAANGKTTSLYERDHRIDLPRGAVSGWTVRVVRLTPDSTSTSLINATNIEAVTTIIDGKFTYPFTALLYVEFNAKSFPNIPKVTIKMKGRKVNVPTNYDPINRTYSGDWDGTFKEAWTNNPAWIAYDIGTNSRFMLGEQINTAMLSKWDMYPIAKRCDELVPDGNGGTEPRFLCDVDIKAQAQAWTLFNDIVAIFGGIQFWGNGKVNIVPDAPADVKQVITRANTIDGVIQYSAGSGRNRYTSVNVGYSNANNHYADDVATVASKKLLDRYKIFRSTDLTAIGCTRESEAQRRGNNLLLTNQEDGTTTFRIGLEGINFMPGEVFAVADDTISGVNLGGRITEVISRSQLILDRTPDATAGDAIFTRTAGGYTERHVISQVQGTTVTLAVNDQLDEDAVAGAVWVIDSANIALQYFRATAVTWEEDSNAFAVSGVTYQPNKYDAVDKGARYDSGRPITAIDYAGQKSPGKPVISSYEQTAQGSRVVTMRIDWAEAAGAIAYEVQWRRNSNDYVNAPRMATKSYEVSNVYSGLYYARVRAIGPGDSSSPWVDADVLTIAGRAGNPPAPVGLTASSDVLWGINLSWGFADDTDDTSYTRLQYSDSSDESTMRELSYVPYPGSKYQLMGIQPGTEFWFRAKLVDKLGNESPWTPVVRGVANANSDEYLDQIGGDFLSAADGEQLLEGFAASLEAAIQNTLNLGGTVERQFAAMGNTKAEIVVLKNTVAKIDSSVADIETNVVAEFDGVKSTLQDKLTAMIDTNQASAVHTLKTGVRINDVEYLAGMSIAVIAESGEPVITRIGFNANQFVLMSGDAGSEQYSPFAVVNGDVFINSAFIRDGTITNAKIEDGAITSAKVGVLQSDNFNASNHTGWQLSKTQFTFGGAGNGGFTTFDQNGLGVYDSNGTERFKAGYLG